MLKYEISEKQRWRIDLKEEDGATWVKKGNNKNIYFDKKNWNYLGKSMNGKVTGK